MTDERAPWDRRPGETSKAYAAFREYRDLGPRRTLRKLTGVNANNARNWSGQWDWGARATAWDDELAREADADRIDALRSMQSTHARAARAVQAFALAALQQLDAGTVTAADVARLLDLGTRLERATLTQPIDNEPRQLYDGDPWAEIARELTGA